MDQLVLLVIIGLISLVNWVMRKAAEKREQAKFEREAGRNIYTRDGGRKPALRRAIPPSEDPLKDLMEALGLPRDAVAPPPVPQRAPELEEEFASLEEPAAPPLPQEAAEVRVRRWQAPEVRRPDEKTALLASRFAAQEKAAPAPSRPSTVRSLLGDRASKRHAIVIAEILGPPRALQPAPAWGANF